MRLELQRLAQPANGATSVVAIDIGAILRGVAEAAPAPVPWNDVAAAVARGGRRALWVVAPTAAGSPFVGDGELNAAELAIARLAPRDSVLRSRQPLVGLLTAGPPSQHLAPRIILATAGIEDHAYEFKVLAGWAYQVVDILTGKSWTSERVARAFGLPGVLPMAFAATAREPDAPALVQLAAQPIYHEPILQALEGTGSILNADVPPTVRAELKRRHVAIEAQASLLSGGGTRDTKARLRVNTWLSQGVHLAPAGTAYITALTEEHGGGFRFAWVEVLEGSSLRVATSHSKAVALLRSVKSPRWFATRALDLLTAAIDARVALPRSAVDPALASFLLNPDQPKPLEDVYEPLYGLPSEQRRWISDLKRHQFAPGQLDGLVTMLPELDTELALILAGEGLSQVFESDISATLPVLAKLERRGAFVGLPRFFRSWPNLAKAVVKRANTLTKQLAGASNIDLVRAPWELVRDELTRRGGRLPRQQWHHALTGEEYVMRMAEQGLTEARTVLRLRSITSATGFPYWVSLLGSGGTPQWLRGRHVPQRTGRWGMAHYPLQNLPKQGVEALLLRSGLQPPPGYVLVRADWNAFEARLVAELSQDPTLMAAARAIDLHAALAKQLNVKRGEAKALTYAILYGQQEDGFFCANPGLSRVDARTLYAAARSALGVAMKYLESEVNKRNRGLWLTAPSGFRRLPAEPGQARNFVVQGFGADCMRWVLRALDIQLEPLGAFIVHQGHDEVLVAAPPKFASAVDRLLRQVMEIDLVNQSGLFKNRTPMRATIKEGSTW